MTWHDFQETKPLLDCEQEAGIETEIATVEEEEKEHEERTPAHEEKEEERIPAKEEDVRTTEPVPQNIQMEWD